MYKEFKISSNMGVFVHRKSDLSIQILIDPISPDPIQSGDLRVSESAIAMIKRFEGFRDTAYKPLSSEKYYTIGYGHHGSDVSVNTTITEEQAETYLREDLAKVESYVKKYCGHLNLNQNQFDALVSFTFNCGEGNLEKLVRNGRNLEQIAASMPYYRKAGGSVIQGLVNRRNEEVALFNTPVSNTPNTETQSVIESNSYQPWQSTVIKKVPAYENSSLTMRTGNEEVWVGDNVDVVDEIDNAYYGAILFLRKKQF